MICPTCGGNTPAPSGPCPNCGSAAEHTEGPAVTAAVLTPPPDPAQAEAGTFISPEVTHLPDPVTVPVQSGTTARIGPHGGPLAAGQSFGTRYTIMRELG